MQVSKAKSSRLEKTDFNDLGFGKFFSDHMFCMEYAGGKWQDPQIVPYEPIGFYPALTTLHYGQCVFEGMKAFHNKDGNVNIFRPDRHHARLNTSSRRLCIPESDYDIFISAIENLVHIDREWIPTKRGCSLYIRPFIFATDNYLGVKVSNDYLYLIITSPVAAYYKEGLNPVRLKTSTEFIRAAKGGLGEAKTPANYAAALLAANKAKQEGFSEVLWLDAVEHKFIEEVGAMNIFFLFEDELVTAPLGGTILPGVTRASVIELSKEWDVNVQERMFSIDEVIEASEKGTLKEVFGTGTAAVISPVGEIQHYGHKLIINDGKIGEFSQKLYDEITGIQYGEKEDKHGWIHTIK